MLELMVKVKESNMDLLGGDGDDPFQVLGEGALESLCKIYKVCRNSSSFTFGSKNRPLILKVCRKSVDVWINVIRRRAN